MRSIFLSVEYPLPVEREGDERRHQNDGDHRPPDRPVEVLDQQPHEELVEKEAQRVDGEEAHRANRGAVARAVTAEAEIAVQDVAEGREYEIVQSQRQHRLDVENRR